MCSVTKRCVLFTVLAAPMYYFLVKQFDSQFVGRLAIVVVL